MVLFSVWQLTVSLVMPIDVLDGLFLQSLIKCHNSADLSAAHQSHC